MTIEGVLTPGVLGGGMNITGVWLNFSNGASPLADFVSSFQAVCDFGGCVTGSELLAVDGDLSFSSIPLLGATLNYPTDPRRMRLTVGWTGISVAEPASFVLAGLGLAGLALRGRRKQR